MLSTNVGGEPSLILLNQWPSSEKLHVHIHGGVLKGEPLSVWPPLPALCPGPGKATTWDLEGAGGGCLSGGRGPPGTLAEPTAI